MSQSTTRAMVESLAGYGVPLGDIAALTGIDEETLEDEYGEALSIGPAKARAKVYQAAFTAASNGKNFAASAAWLKENANWSSAVPDTQDAAAPVFGDDIACLATERRIRGR